MERDVVARLRENLERVRSRIERAAEQSGRTGADVKMVAVTKYVDADVTQALVQAGQTVLGESRPQVLWDKTEAVNSSDIEWHMIGHLQRNKVQRTIRHCHLVHSVDSARLLKAIDQSSQQQDRITNCLLEVNISGEEAKHGWSAHEIESALISASQLKGIKIVGLMGMASLAGGADENRLQFAELRKLRDGLQHLNGGNIDLGELSMGMSGDFEAAIAEGATLVRIGSLLFDGI